MCGMNLLGYFNSQVNDATIKKINQNRMK